MTTEIFINHKGIEDLKVKVAYRLNGAYIRATPHEEAEQPEPEILKVTLAQDVDEPQFSGKKGDQIEYDGDTEAAIYEELLP